MPGWAGADKKEDQDEKSAKGDEEDGEKDEKLTKEQKEWKRITKMYGTLFKANEEKEKDIKRKKMDPNLKQHLEYRK